MTFNIADHFKSIDVLDHGFVSLIDGMYTEPKLKIINAAKASYHKEVDEVDERGLKLIDYLQQHKHGSCFRHSYFTFRICAPLFVFRQITKHQVGVEWLEVKEGLGSIEIPTSWNETSYRYTEAEPNFYIPSKFRMQSTKNKQCSEEGKEDILIDENNILNADNFYFYTSKLAYDQYKTLIEAGVAREQARIILPQNIYSECVVTLSLQALHYLIDLRIANESQFETREYAKAIKELVKFTYIDE